MNEIPKVVLYITQSQNGYSIGGHCLQMPAVRHQMTVTQFIVCYDLNDCLNNCRQNVSKLVRSSRRQ